MSKTLFLFKFSGAFDSHAWDLLREASGMRINLGNTFDREPGQGTVGRAVHLRLSEGDAPGAWEIEARTHFPNEMYDAEEVERRRQRISEVLARIADRWEEIGPT